MDFIPANYTETRQLVPPAHLPFRMPLYPLPVLLAIGGRLWQFFSVEPHFRWLALGMMAAGSGACFCSGAGG